LLLAGTLLMIVVSFPLLAVLVLVLRPVLAVAAVFGLVTVFVVAICSPRFREWFGTVGEEQIHYKGLRFAPEIAVHPCHSWARINGQKADVGVDDLVQSTLGPVEGVELPSIGKWYHQGAPLFTLRRGERVLQVRSPISGTVVATNRALLDLPDLINQTPFTKGWAVRMRADQTLQESQGLLRGRQARDWFRREVDRLIESLFSCQTIGTAMPDGGALVGDLHSQISDRDWRGLTVDFFGVPRVMIRPARVAPSHPL
jgi:glycine cleavage system H lipoate-binding protein